MVPNPAIRNLIREDKVHQVYSQMQIGQDKFGMQTMNQSLAELYLKRLITYDDAMGRSSDSASPRSGTERRTSPSSSTTSPASTPSSWEEA